MTDNKNTILAIALSALVLIAWQYFFAGPQQKVRQEQLQAQQQQQQKQATEPVQPAQPAAPAAPKMTGLQTSCSATEGAGNRVAIDTDSLKGSISLKGGCIDELSLVKYHETIDPHSPPEFRCNGVIRNLDVFYDAFEVSEKDGLYLDPQRRVRIWN